MSADRIEGDASLHSLHQREASPYGKSWEATLYRAKGPQFIGAAFDPSQVERTVVGSLILEFVGYPLRVGTEEYPRTGQARLTYEIDAIRVTKVIERLPFQVRGRGRKSPASAEGSQV